ncbi:MAG: non-heme iron oxygenase ferredoxin subunit [Chloroflexi bacterium]|nr:non-heme iron oxygenase ferredoxin subunit [Chloroflexota bacterium]
MSDAVDLSKYEFVRVIEASEIQSGERVLVEVDEQPIAVFNISGKYYAIGDVCTHDGGPLGDGELDGYQIICPRHGARFDVRTGKALTLPAVVDTPWYPVRVEDGWIEVGLPEE